MFLLFGQRTGSAAEHPYVAAGDFAESPSSCSDTPRTNEPDPASYGSSRQGDLLRGPSERKNPNDRPSKD